MQSDKFSSSSPLSWRYATELGNMYGPLPREAMLMHAFNIDASHPSTTGRDRLDRQLPMHTSYQCPQRHKYTFMYSLVYSTTLQAQHMQGVTFAGYHAPRFIIPYKEIDGTRNYIPEFSNAY